MANNFSTNPWTIDSVMASAYKAGVYLGNIIWDEQAAAGDQVVIVDQNGKLILDTKASAQNVFQNLGKIGWVNGFQVTTLGSGKLTVAISK